SETFGLYESTDEEYPAQLRRLLPERDVVNAALAGMTLKSTRIYWHRWASKFEPTQVLIYPSPLFYLNDEDASVQSHDSKTMQPVEQGFGFRLQDRLREAYRQLPAWIKDLREDWVVRNQTAGKDPSWYYSAVPVDRIL